MNRRDLLHGFTVGAAVVLLPFDPVWAQARTVSRVVVDTGPLEARGGRGAAAVIRPQLQASLQKEFAGRIGRGPELIVRIQTVMLAPFSAGSDDIGGGVPSDYLEGEIVIGRERIPMTVSVSSDSGGTWYVPGFDERRLRALADGFASWVARRV